MTLPKLDDDVRSLTMAPTVAEFKSSLPDLVPTNLAKQMKTDPKEQAALLLIWPNRPVRTHRSPTPFFIRQPTFRQLWLTPVLQVLRIFHVDVQILAVRSQSGDPFGQIS